VIGQRPPWRSAVLYDSRVLAKLPSVSRRVAVGLAAALLMAPLMAVSWADQGNPPPATEGQTPVFRGGVNFVSVDAFPRRDGKVIEGLTAQDFQIFEDGRPQKVDTFQFIRIETNPVDSDRRDPSSQAEGDRAARDPRNRVFVVYLDLAHTTLAGSHAARQPVVDFLTRTIGRTDVFGVMTAETPAGQLDVGAGRSARGGPAHTGRAAARRVRAGLSVTCGPRRRAITADALA
jgi:hypothetical protein